MAASSGATVCRQPYNEEQCVRLEPAERCSDHQMGGRCLSCDRVMGCHVAAHRRMCADESVKGLKLVQMRLREHTVKLLVFRLLF